MTNSKLSLKQISTNQIVGEEKRDRRFSKGMIVAVSCEIVRLDNQKDIYKVQSENDVNKYYIVKFMDGTPIFCTCKDYEIQIKKNERHICKYQCAIVLAEKYGLVVSIQQKQNVNVSNDTFNDTEQSSIVNEDDSISYCQSHNLAKFEETMMTKTTVGPRSYKDDDYTF